MCILSLKKNNMNCLANLNYITTDIYYIEEIRDHGIRHGKREFFIQWQGFSDEEQLWEPESNFLTDLSDFADSSHPYEFLLYGHLTKSEGKWSS